LTDPAETGAVTICLPQDVQGETYDYPMEFLEKRVHFIQRRGMDERMVQQAADLICRKEKPFVIMGGGVQYSEAAAEMIEFTRAFNIPFGETQAGKGIILFDNPYNMGGAGLTGTSATNKLAAKADLIIGVGTRLNDFCTCSKWAYQNEEMEMISINVNPMDAYKMNAMPIFSDAKLGLQALTVELKKRGYKSGYTGEIAEARKEWDEEVDRLYTLEHKDGLAQSRILGELNEHLLAKDAIMVTASGSLPSDLQRVWRCREEGVYHVEYAFSCMGYEVNAALGVKIAEPDREVYAILGDGSFQMLHSEFVTSLQEQIKINLIVLDNNGCQCIHNLQKSQGIPSFANEYRYREEGTKRLTGAYIPIDYAMVARGYGGNGYTATTLEELKIGMEAMKKSEKSTLIDIKTVPGTMTDGYDAWWRVGVAQLSKHKEVEAAAEDVRKHVEMARKF